MATSSPSNENLLEGVQELKELTGKNWVSLRQAAQLIGVSYQVVLKYVKSDPDKPGSVPKLRAVRVGGQWRVYEDELRRFLERGNNSESLTSSGS